MSERADARRIAIRGTCALVAALLAAGLSGCVREPTPLTTAGLSDPQVEEMARLTRQAIQHLQAQLEVQSEDISVESIQPLVPLCGNPDMCPPTRSGYVIRLVVGELVYECNVKELNGMSILWREVPPTSSCLRSRRYNGLGVATEAQAKRGE